MALVFPTAAQAAAQTPVNTYSPTSTPLTNTSNGFVYVYDPVTGQWNISSSGGSQVTGWSGGTTGLTPSTPTSGDVVLGGVLNVANGGTGATTQAAAAAAVLPTQSGQAGGYLTTNGTTTSWAAIPAPEFFPAGTRLIFSQTSAPTGWVQVTDATYNDASMRLVTGAGGGTGGSLAFSTLFSPTSTYSGSISITSGQVGNTTLATSQMPSHSHSTGLSSASGTGGPAVMGGSSPSGGIATSSTGGDGSHTHSLAGAAATGNFTSNFAVKYVNMIVATKS